MTAPDLAAALLRTTLATSAAFCLAALLLARLRVHAPRTHRIAWSLVVLQGWALLPWTITLRQPAPAEITAPTTMFAPAGADFIPIPADAPILITTPPAVPDPWRPADLAPTTIVAWLAGALTLAFFAVARYARLAAALPRGAAPDNAAWQTEWQRELARARGGRGGDSASRLPFPKRIDFRITQSLGPLVAFIPPAYRVLAPHSLWTALTRPRRRAILRHELAHIRRRDLWKSLALRALALPQWFNPLVWLAVRRFDEAAEWSCDAIAARGLARQPTTIAAALVRTAELTTSHSSIATLGFIPAIPAGHRTPLARRIHRLVTPRFKEESIMRKLLVPALLATLAAAQLIRIDRVVAEGERSFEIAASLGETSDADAELVVDPAMTVADWMAQPRIDGAVQSAVTTGDAAVPHDRKKITLPIYVVEPPDILLIEGVKLVPKLPYRIQCFDVLQVRFPGEQEHQFTDVDFLVVPGGTIHLGVNEGNVAVAGLTLEEAQDEIRQRLRNRKAKEVTVSLREIGNAQKISGQHLVAMDGRVNLGVYGSVFVAGLTIAETRAAIEKHLAEDFDDPQVSVDVQGYNSKVYYIITAGGAAGDDVVRAPITGNETVLDAVANLGGLAQAAATKMWIARPAPQGVGSEQILPVAWNDIARGASTETNYQLLPGDRLFIETTAPPETKEPAGATSEASPAPKIIGLTVKSAGGLERQSPEATDARTVGEFLRSLGPLRVTDDPGEAAPSISEAMITLTRERGPVGSGETVSWPIGWGPDELSPSGDGDRELLHGDGITLDFRGPEPGAVVLPNPVPTPPKTAPPTEAPSPTKDQLEFSIAFIEDLDGDLADFVGMPSARAILDTPTFLTALRVLEKRSLVKRLADPTLIASNGVSAQATVGVPIEGQQKAFRNAQQVKVTGRITKQGASGSYFVIELDARANHAGQSYSVNCRLHMHEHKTALVRLRSADGEPTSPIFVVVRPSMPD